MKIDKLSLGLCIGFMVGLVGAILLLRAIYADSIDRWNEDNVKAVVTDVNNNGECVCVITENGSAEDWCSEGATKTGRHFPQITEVLKQMKED